MSTFPLRLPEHVMDDARLLAQQSGVSLNQLFLSMIAERIGELKGIREVKARAERADVAKALAALDRIPHGPVVPGDELEPVPPPPQRRGRGPRRNFRDNIEGVTKSRA